MLRGGVWNMTKQQKQKKAEQLLKYYQPILRLQDWDISITVMDEDEYTKRHGADYAETTGACNEIITQTKRSHIYLRLEEQTQPFVENLIHELAHLMAQEQWYFINSHLDQMPNTEARQLVKETHDHFLEVTVSNIVRAVSCCLISGGKYKE